MKYRFEWSHEKAKSNLVKHGVSFEEAKSVLDDPLAYIFEDEVHSSVERREIIIGHSIAKRLLLVVFTERFNKIRIISTRLATKKESKDYEENI
ncbi:MAG: BrnT family toxin [Bacteroidetes bacterium]|nr:BrnT family toxin [Bacteroidota bacterium]MBU1422789.1 BrnT family toxin [Bacteroidota bacterium]